MPGVPSSRGCDACRKQKKKCDQSKPSCSRCIRLQISCVGSGQQRYKFKEQIIASRSGKTPAAQEPVLDLVRRTPTVPGNDVISILGMTDLRHDVKYYGGFLIEIPKRLGENAALDASMSALTSIFPSTYTQQQTPEMIRKYVHALRMVRIYLSDPAKAYTSHTLCAIYLIDVCQSWIGRHDDKPVSHGEIMAYFLNHAPLENWRGTFEFELVITICGAVIIESLVNPKICLDKFFFNFANVYGQMHGPHKPRRFDDDSPTESLQLHNIAKIGQYLRDPELHLLKITSFYQEIRADSQKVRYQMVQWAKSALVTQTSSQPYIIGKQHTVYQATHAIAISLCLVLGNVLRIFDPNDSVLVEDLANFTGDVIQLAKDSSQYRPLGSSYMPFCLIAAWAVADGTPQQMEVETILKDWQSDFKEARWMALAEQSKTFFDDLRLRVLMSQLDLDSFDQTGIVRQKRGSNEAPTSCVIL